MRLSGSRHGLSVREIALSGALTQKFISYHTSSLAEGHALAYDWPL